MRISFQFLKEGAPKPDTTTLSDVFQNVKDGEPIPSLGDFVNLPYTAPIEKRGKNETFIVKARHFFYCDNKQIDQIIIIVGLASDIPESNFRE